MPTPWQGVRHDAFTIRFALDYPRRMRRRVLYVAFDETDDWAHDGRYDQVLESLHRTDDYLRQLWEELPRQTQYRNRTTVIVTVDHGRGRSADDWRNHGIKVPQRRRAPARADGKRPKPMLFRFMIIENVDPGGMCVPYARRTRQTGIRSANAAQTTSISLAWRGARRFETPAATTPRSCARAGVRSVQ
jgi:hypothetical protein